MLHGPQGGSVHDNHSTSNCHIAARAAGRCKSIRLGHKNEKSNQRRLGSERKSAGQPAIAGTGSRARRQDRIIHAGSTRCIPSRESDCQRRLRGRRGGPCFAFQNIGGKLNRLHRCAGLRFVVDGRDRMACTALGDDITCAAFAAPALCGNTQFKLDFVKAHPRMRVACYFSVRNPAAYTDDHGYRQLLLAIDVIGGV